MEPVELQPDLYKRVEVEAKLAGCSVSEYVNRFLRSMVHPDPNVHLGIPGQNAEGSFGEG